VQFLPDEHQWVIYDKILHLGLLFNQIKQINIRRYRRRNYIILVRGFYQIWVMVQKNYLCNNASPVIWFETHPEPMLNKVSRFDLEKRCYIPLVSARKTN